MGRMQNVEIAEALFAALARNDAAAVRNLCAPDISVRQNGGASLNLEALLTFNAAVQRVVSDFRYEVPVRSATASGFVEEHAVRGILPNGKQLDLMVCVVCDIRDGKVTDLREYLDMKAAADLIAALR
jgi:ketosteroid isomerase-like protein